MVRVVSLFFTKVKSPFAYEHFIERSSGVAMRPHLLTRIPHQRYRIREKIFAMSNRKTEVFWVLRRCVRSYFLLLRWLLSNTNTFDVPCRCTDGKSYKACSYFQSFQFDLNYSRQIGSGKAND